MSILKLKIIEEFFAIIKKNNRSYLFLNVFFYGLIVCGMIISYFYPETQQSIIKRLGVDFKMGPLSFIGNSIKNGNLLLTVILIFSFNYFIQSLCLMSIPSLILPYTGLLINSVRMIYWGIIFSPVGIKIQPLIFPTILLEAQGYIIISYSIYLHWKMTLFPKYNGLPNRRMGYVSGLKLLARINIMAIIFLLLAAIYESIQVIYMPEAIQYLK